MFKGIYFVFVILVLINFNIVLSYPYGFGTCPNNYYYVNNIDNINPIVELVCNNIDVLFGIYCCPNCNVINCRYLLNLQLSSK